MYDLHLHSTCSDGDVVPSAVVEAATQRGVTGMALTDHNGIWGLEEAGAAAAKQGIVFVAGIEVSSYYQGSDVHILGLANRFRSPVLESGLRSTRLGCVERVRAMVHRCHEAGFTQVSLNSIAARYQGVTEPSYISFDVTRELVEKHRLPLPEAHRMTVAGGTCYVPYGDWLLTPTEVVEVLHAAGAVAVLAHPGIFSHEASKAELATLIEALVASGLDGLEVRHPFHTPAVQAEMSAAADKHQLVITGGSDWHGPSRFAANHAAFGTMGLTANEFATLQQAMDRLA